MNRRFKHLVVLWLGVVAGVALFGNNYLHVDTKEPPKDAPAATVFPAPPQPNPTVQPLEFRGVLIDEDGEVFRINERGAKSSLWVGLNEAGAPFVVRHFDSHRQVVTVEYQGRMLTLPLKRPRMPPRELTGRKSILLKQPPASDMLDATTLPTRAGDKASVSAVTTQPSGAARVDAIKSEVSRRTAERQQATAVVPVAPESKDSK